MKKITLSLIIMLAAIVATAQTHTFQNVMSGITPDLNSTAELNGKMFFAATTTSFGKELWFTNGTTAGTDLAKDIRPNGDSNPVNLVQFANKIFFTADDGTNGKEIWASDGINANTNLMKDLNTTAGAGSNPDEFTVFNNKLIFSANNGSIGEAPWALSYYRNPATNAYLYSYNILKDINPSGNSNPYYFTEYKGKLYFNANDGALGQELWVTDGTGAGTVLFKDIYTGSVGANPSKFYVFNNKLYFFAHGQPNYIRKLWVSDGTAAGTNVVPDDYPANAFSVTSMADCNGYLYFADYDYDLDILKLWRSNGTKVELVDNGVYGANYLTKLNNDLYFIGNSKSLYKLNGATGTIELVKVIDTSAKANDFPSKDLIVYNGKIYFRGYNTINGYRLWVSDGTANGTNAIAPLNSTKFDPLFNYTSTINLQIFNGELYFPADFDAAGLSLWKIKTTPTSVRNTAYIEASVSPNPVKDILHINTDHNVKEVRLISTSGQQVRTWYGEKSIDMSGIASGIYLVQIDTDSGRAVKKVVKE